VPPYVFRKPILIFDTSGLNNLAAEPDFDALVAGLTAAYFTRITASNISEIAATTKPNNRGRLLDACQRLLASGECIDPFHWIVENHVKAFDINPKDYNWEQVKIRSPQLEQEIVRRTFFDDELARQERESACETKKSFEDTFCAMRPGFDQIFASDPERPGTFDEFVKILQQSGGAFWTGYGHDLYARNVETAPDEGKIRDLADRCPPFLMMVLSVVMAQYKRAITKLPIKKKRAGRVDLLMSIYLPYCRVFVTHDENQEACLREMAEAASIDCEILSYKEFRSRLLGPQDSATSSTPAAR
jgi:hypothetical protein